MPCSCQLAPSRRLAQVHPGTSDARRGGRAMFLPAGQATAPCSGACRLFIQSGEAVCPPQSAQCGAEPVGAGRAGEHLADTLQLRHSAPDLADSWHMGLSSSLQVKHHLC